MNMSKKHLIPMILVFTAGLCQLAQAGNPGEPVELDEAKLFLEQNATDGDLGLHFKADGDGWDRLVLMDEQGRRLVDVKVKGNLGNAIGLTEIFSESAEPGFDEFPKEDFLSLFPEGTYYFEGVSLEQEWLEGVATLTHILPDEVELLLPVEDSGVSPDEDLVVAWVPAPDPDYPDSVIEFYEVVVEKDEEDELLRVFSVHMLPHDSYVRVPAEFLEADKDYKVEIIAEETSGNRTAIEVPFYTLD